MDSFTQYKSVSPSSSHLPYHLLSPRSTPPVFPLKKRAGLKRDKSQTGQNKMQWVNIKDLLSRLDQAIQQEKMCPKSRPKNQTYTDFYC